MWCLQGRAIELNDQFTPDYVARAVFGVCCASSRRVQHSAHMCHVASIVRQLQLSQDQRQFPPPYGSICVTHTRVEVTCIYEADTTIVSQTLEVVLL